MSNVSEILLQHGRDVARAAETRGQARAQLAGTLGAIPGQVINNYQQMTEFAQQREAQQTQQRTATAQATTAEVGARAATTNERDLNAYKEIIGKLPKMVENGVELTDVKRLNDELVAARIDPAPYVQHAQAMNTAFRAETTARQALVKTAVDQVAAAGNNPGLADDTIDSFVRSKLIAPEDGEKYKRFYTTGDDGQPLPLAERIARVGQLTQYLGNPRKPIEVSAGAQQFDPITHQPVGPQVPANPTQASIATAAANGDPTAVKALELLKGAGANPTAASLALKAAQGDAEAIKALEILKQQQRVPAGPQPQYQWAKDKDGNERLMTPTEIREGGAQRPETADMRNKEVARGLVTRSIGSLEALSQRIVTKIGPAQRADAIKRGVDAVFGNDPEFRTYQDARVALAGNLAVAQQGARPSDADIKLVWLPLVPDAYRDTSESAKMKWDLVKTNIGIAQPPATAAPQEGATRPITEAGYPAGAEQTFRNGQWIRTK